MKKRKQKALKYLGLSIVCFGLHACSIFLEPFAVNSENKVAAGGYILGVLFWVTLLAGAVLFGVCREIISKTAAGEWALQNCLFHNITALETALEVRKNPQKYLESAELQALSGKLGNAIQQYADVLEKELKTTSFVGGCTF